MMAKKLLLILNPVAGRKGIQKVVPQIVRIFMNAGYLVTTMVTAEKGEAGSFVRQFGGDHELIVAAGGDGTLNEVVSGLLAEKLTVPVGYIPCGSTNVFAEAHGISSDMLAAAGAIAQGGLREVDLGSFGEQLFASTATFGAFTWMAYIKDQELKNHLGFGAYVLDGAHDLSRLKPWHVRITMNGERFEDDYIFGAISNTPSLAGVLQYPQGLVDMEDGRLEVLLIRSPQSMTDWQKLLRSIRLRDYDASPLIEIGQAESILVENPEGLIWALDGESSGEFQTAQISVLNRALKLKA